MRFVLVALMLAVAPAFGQDPAAACGPASAQFKVNLDRSPHSAGQPEAGKARIYFIHDAATVAGVVPYPTVKIAMDGVWVGANHGDSFFQVDALPGEHHVCATLQSRLLLPRVELAHFRAEAGKTYFYRTQLLLSGEVEALELQAVDSDEGLYLVSKYPLSLWKPKH